MQYKLIVENFREYKKTLQEDVYTPELRKFIEYANELESSYERGQDWMGIVRKLNEYAKENFRFLGAGVSRSVYRTPGREIVKMIKANPFNKHTAIEANQKEIAVFDRHDISTIFPRIYEKSGMDLWYVTEEMTPLDTIHEKYRMVLFKRWFPKLWNIVEKGRELKSPHSDPPSFIYPSSFLGIAANVAAHVAGNGMSKTDLVVMFTDYFAQHARGSSGEYFGTPRKSNISDEYVQLIYEYLANPDQMIKTLGAILRATNTKYQDIHAGNLAVDDDENLKIIDI